MNKVFKQVCVNVLTVMVSFFLLYIVKSVNKGNFLDISECFGADFVFIMISALATTAGWRFAEGIEGWWPYNVFLCVEGMVLFFEYGYALGESSDILITITKWTAVAFIIFYILENMIICLYFRNAKTHYKNGTDSYSYKDREREE